jgi:hypothetical protein
MLQRSETCVRQQHDTTKIQHATCCNVGAAVLFGDESSTVTTHPVDIEKTNRINGFSESESSEHPIVVVQPYFGHTFVISIENLTKRFDGCNYEGQSPRVKFTIGRYGCIVALRPDERPTSLQLRKNTRGPLSANASAYNVCDGASSSQLQV